MRVFLFLFILAGCSGHLFKGKPREGRNTYSYVDASGTYRLARETKQVGQKVVTRNQILDNRGGRPQVLEKSVLVSQIGSIKSGKARLLTVRPVASEFTVWLEGKKYVSKMKLDPKKKVMAVSLDSPEKKWQGAHEVPFPKSKYFCFFNQIPECLYHNYLLTLARENEVQKFDFYLIWDGYPFIQDQLTMVGKNLFTPASVKFDGENKGLFRYIVEVDGQMVLYQFSKSFDLVKAAWIAQGITIAPPGQGIVED
ncbi:MAG: hypothetical protein ACLGHN_11910 [Bacteriovoracia bacterium]